jgi:hypothetical protein
MLFMNLLVALVAGVILFEPFTRAPLSRYMAPSARRNRAMRSFMQAGIALIAAMMVATSAPSPDHISPLMVLGIAALLILASVYWTMRGKQLLKPRKMFH